MKTTTETGRPCNCGALGCVHVHDISTGKCVPMSPAMMDFFIKAVNEHAALVAVAEAQEQYHQARIRFANEGDYSETVKAYRKVREAQAALSALRK